MSSLIRVQHIIGIVFANWRRLQILFIWGVIPWHILLDQFCKTTEKAD
ncbi:MAG: hypothetical protein OXU51_15210 [Candidatus Poribacteria bacterium]|nr:hypothetical protein [Candidatus Poribacteria bacterium]